MTADMPALIEQLATKAIECRELLGDVRSATKGLRNAERDANEARAKLATAVEEMVDQDIGGRIRDGLAEYEETLQKAIDDAVEKVGKEFEKLMNIYMTGDNRGRPPDGRDLQRLMEERGRR